MASVTYDHVTKKFGETVAVDNLDIKVEDKEFLVLVGPSGCGKTTALRCLAGLEEITNGQIMIGERVVNDVAPKDRDIAMVFQSYALYPHLSVFDNMAFGLKLRRVPKGYKLPSCSVKQALVQWMCGNSALNVPPLRTLHAADLGTDKDPSERNQRRRLAELRFLNEIASYEQSSLARDGANGQWRM